MIDPVLRHLIHQADGVGNLFLDGCRCLTEVLLVACLVVAGVRLVRVAVTAHLENEDYFVRLDHNFISLKTNFRKV